MVIVAATGTYCNWEREILYATFRKVLGDDRFTLKQIGDAEDLKSWLTRSAKKGGHDRRSPVVLASAPEYCPIHLSEVKRMLYEHSELAYLPAFCAADPKPWSVNSPSLTVPPGIDDVVRKEGPSLLSRLRSKLSTRSSKGEHSAKPSENSSLATASDHVLSSIRRGVKRVRFLDSLLSADSSRRGDAKAGQAELGGIELSAAQQTGTTAPTPLTRALSSDSGETTALPAPKHSAPSAAAPPAGNAASLPLGWRTSLPLGWRTATSPEGLPYFYHKDSGETSWSWPS